MLPSVVWVEESKNGAGFENRTYLWGRSNNVPTCNLWAIQLHNLPKKTKFLASSICQSSLASPILIRWWQEMARWNHDTRGVSFWPCSSFRGAAKNNKLFQGKQRVGKSYLPWFSLGKLLPVSARIGHWRNWKWLELATPRLNTWK